MIVAESTAPVTDKPFFAGSVTPASNDRRIAVCALAIGLGLTILCGRVHPDGLIHFDDLTHYLIARWAWTWPTYLLNDWGRPGFTILYFLPAALGWSACKLLSAVLHGAAAWLAYRIAGRLGVRHAWAVIPLCYLQPLFFNLSQTTLTETPMAFYVTLAIYLGMTTRWGWSAAVMSLAFITRHEAVILALPWAWCAWRSGVALRHWWPLAWAPIAINLLAIACGVTPALQLLLSPTASTQYGHGGWLTYLCRSMESSGPGIMVLAIIGLAVLWRNRSARLPLAVALTYFFAHTAIRALGLYASGGYARFLVPIAPIIAIAALAGWNRFFDDDAAEQRRAFLTAAAAMLMLAASLERQVALHLQSNDILTEMARVHQAKFVVRISTVLLGASCVIAAMATRRGRSRSASQESGLRPTARITTLPPMLIASLIVLAAWQLARPLRPPHDAPIIRDALVWLDANGYAGRPVISSTVWIDYVMGRDLPPDRPTERERLAAAPLGTLFAWEAQFAGSEDHGLMFVEFADSPAWRLVHRSAPRPSATEPYLFFFEKIADWTAARPQPAVAPSTRPS